MFVSYSNKLVFVYIVVTGSLFLFVYPTEGNPGKITVSNWIEVATQLVTLPANRSE